MCDGTDCSCVVNWHDVLPFEVAVAQERFERRHRILIACEAGALMTDIAKHEGLAPSRIGQLRNQAYRDRKRRISAPISRYLAMHDVMLLVMESLKPQDAK